MRPSPERGSRLVIARPCAIADVVVLEPTVYEDDRGFFFESFNVRTFAEITGLEREFVQDNHSRSTKNVLRGLHFQNPQPQGKLVRVVVGAVYDVAVDLRRSSASFGKWVGVELTADNRRQLWVPEGFGHGFLVVSDEAEVIYKTTDYFAAEHDRAIRWDDPDLAIEWPLSDPPILSAKDASAPGLREADVFA